MNVRSLVRPRAIGLRTANIELFVLLAFLGAVLSGGQARAEVTLAHTDTWEVYSSGRVGAFFSYGFGDANPIPSASDPTENIIPGGGLSVGVDSIPKTNAQGQPIQGTFQNMRVRSGFVPNVLGLGFRRRLTDWTTLNVYVATWATIDSDVQRKTQPILVNGQEGYLKLEGPWGSFLAGRALDLFSRGATQNDFLYLHGYAMGFPGNIDSAGPTAGLLGFGVLAAFFSPGLVYATPTSYGLQLTVGVYDPTPLPGGYEATRFARPEGELTYDLARGSMKLHLFTNTEFQPVYRTGSNTNVKSYGVGYGGRLELGRLHFGAAGHWGKGLGLAYALESDDVSVSQNFELRTFDGYSAIAQYSATKFDFNVGWGISRVFRLPSDDSAASAQNSLIKYQMGYAAVIVYHVADYLHFELEYFRGDAHWFGAPAVLAMGGSPERQVINFVTTGVTATW
jgi:hypothetical protein